MAEWGGVHYIVVVSYTDGSALLGAYGPYPTQSAAQIALPQLQQLPGMDPGNRWEVMLLWQVPLVPFSAHAAKDQAVGTADG